MTCMRVKGIPFDAEEGDVNEFFAGLTVIGLLMCTDNGKKTGEAYVEFATLWEVLKVKQQQSHSFCCSHLLRLGLLQKSWIDGRSLLRSSSCSQA